MKFNQFRERALARLKNVSPSFGGKTHTYSLRHMECTVCHKHFTLPTLLPCGHLLCRHCLVQWLKSQPEAKCPVCRCAIVDPKERKGRGRLEDIADGFPTDLAMAALVEADRLLSKLHVCCVCVKVVTVSMCLSCGNMFCQLCTRNSRPQNIIIIIIINPLTARVVGAPQMILQPVFSIFPVLHCPLTNICLATIQKRRFLFFSDFFFSFDMRLTDQL